MNVLNEYLYRLLDERVPGGVRKVIHQGEKADYSSVIDPRDGRQRLQLIHWGELYSMDCPYCGDQRSRLYVCHLFGVCLEGFEPNTTLSLIKCFNEENCFSNYETRADFIRKILGTLTVNERISYFNVKPGQQVIIDGELRETDPPGIIVPLTDLPYNHTAVNYVRSRGFDVEELVRLWQVGYCTFSPRYDLLNDRVVFPIYANGRLVGWQGRVVGDIPPHSKTIRKYYTMPGLKKSRLLYNADLAFQMPVIVLCEGPTDVCRIGPCGVASLGTSVSRWQLDTLASRGIDKLVLICFDADDPKTKSLSENVYSYLTDRRTNAVSISLPEGTDPGSLPREVLWSTFRDQANRAGFSIPEGIERREPCPLLKPNSTSASKRSGYFARS